MIDDYFPLGGKYLVMRGKGFVVWFLFSLTSLAALPASGQGQPSRAEEVTALLPVARIERGAAAPIDANRMDPIFWRDWFETEERGRARLGLLDGSIINVGSAARLQVLQHSQATETTELLLQAGKVRAWMRKLGTSSRQFRVRTNAAVIGVIGTHVYIHAEPNLTTVINVSG